MLYPSTLRSEVSGTVYPKMGIVNLNPPKTRIRISANKQTRMAEKISNISEVMLENYSENLGRISLIAYICRIVLKIQVRSQSKNQSTINL